MNRVLILAAMGLLSAVTAQAGIIGDPLNGNISWALGITPNQSWTGRVASLSTVEFSGWFDHGSGGTMEFSLDVTGEDTFTLSVYNNRAEVAGFFPVTGAISDIDWIGDPTRQVTGISLVSQTNGSVLSTDFTSDSVSVQVQPPGGAIGGYQTMSWNFAIQSAVVPEPASAMVLMGVVPLLGLRRQRKDM